MTDADERSISLCFCLKSWIALLRGFAFRAVMTPIKGGMVTVKNGLCSPDDAITCREEPLLSDMRPSPIPSEIAMMILVKRQILGIFMVRSYA